MNLLPAILLFAFSPFVLLQNGKSDAENAKLLVGTWVGVHDENDFVKESQYTYFADGNFTSYAVFASPESDSKVEVDGAWKVENGFLIETISKSSDPEYPKVGDTFRDKIITLTEHAFHYESQSGREHARVKKRGTESD